ncbi:hypothetical protein HK097_011197 [Rhizophlyctis rosea]|uniref:TLC domain-containing protein n=1 Tax=Rhizophlyctis rosea TaxID=64517 RepID=A0AAD5X578_9FUNG|nr:hypothetical protein HK097_011197 [Rhizophlyctis rosea]
MVANIRSFLEVLTAADFTVPLFLSAFLLISSYATLPRLFPTTFTSEKSRAWILTFIAAITLTLGSLPFLHSHLVLGRASMASSPLVDSTFARSICAFFVAYLLCDLGVGATCYPKQMNFWSGYFHHTLYTFMVLGLLAAGVPGGFCTMGILELPTAVMALGCFNKKWRNDAVFGATFFLTRIMIHAYFIVDLYHSFPGRPLWTVLAGVMPLHIMWFCGWINQQVRIRREKAALNAAMGEKAAAEKEVDCGESTLKSAEVLDAEELATAMAVTKASPRVHKSANRPHRQQRLPRMRSGATLRERTPVHQNLFTSHRNLSVPAA